MSDFSPISVFSRSPSHPLLWRELQRAEGLVREETGLDLTFSDGRAGTLRFDLKGLRAGLFSVRLSGALDAAQMSLRFNGGIIDRVGEEDFLPTIAHEYAHAVVFVLGQNAGRKAFRRDDFRPHGEIWSSLMRLFGHSPDRCHSYPVTPARRRKLYGYRCAGCNREYRLGVVRHERLAKNPGYLVCGRCRGSLRHEPETPVSV
ncbi:MAG: SprT-like domain-containing protein [Nitrospirae bacterium]|nr:SprT-like domain-containing protein [Nitrospirota bacterium]MCL5285084.1 SprT-like domain-containing protein [Nitrospirota bacterium]